MTECVCCGDDSEGRRFCEECSGVPGKTATGEMRDRAELFLGASPLMSLVELLTQFGAAEVARERARVANELLCTVNRNSMEDENGNLRTSG